MFCCLLVQVRGVKRFELVVKAAKAYTAGAPRTGQELAMDALASASEEQLAGDNRTGLPSLTAADKIVQVRLAHPLRGQHVSRVSAGAPCVA